MPSKNKPLTQAELAASESKRDLAAELLQSVREMQSGKVHVVSSPVIEARKRNLRHSLECLPVRFKVGSKAANNRVAPLVPCSQLPAQTQKHCWRSHPSDRFVAQAPNPSVVGTPSDKAAPRP